jgi:hypothetical protein
VPVFSTVEQQAECILPWTTFDRHTGAILETLRAAADGLKNVTGVDVMEYFWRAIGCRPSKRSIKHGVRRIHALTVEPIVWQETTALMGKLNRLLPGWAKYFQVGAVSRAYRALDSYTTAAVRGPQSWHADRSYLA